MRLLKYSSIFVIIIICWWISESICSAFASVLCSTFKFQINRCHGPTTNQYELDCLYLRSSHQALKIQFGTFENFPVSKRLSGFSINHPESGVFHFFFAQSIICNIRFHQNIHFEISKSDNADFFYCGRNLSNGLYYTRTMAHGT
jgi:hypothetical protein